MEETPPPPAASSDPAKTPAAAPAPAGPAPISIDDFKKVVMKVGRIIAAEPHPDADRLLVVKVEVGEAAPRQIVAGIRKWWAPEALEGRTVVIVANLKPATLRGVESQGMILAVEGEEKVIPLGVDGGVAPGTRVT